MHRRRSPLAFLPLLIAGCDPASAVTPDTPAAYHAGPLRVGDAVPDLPFPDLPGADAEPLSLHDLRGETVVVEFLATWCGPCREAVPHLNALAEEFAGEPVRFLAVSLDDPAAVAEFLDATPFAARPGSDDGAVWHDAFGVATVPTTVLIGPDGTLAVVTRPGEVDATLIERVAAGETVADGAPLPPADPEDADPLFRLLIRDVAGEPGAADFASRLRGNLPDRTAADLIRFAFQGEPEKAAERVARLSDQYAEGRYDLIYRFPSDTPSFAGEFMLRVAVLSAFDLARPGST